MSRKHYTEEQIEFEACQYESATPTAEIIRKMMIVEIYKQKGLREGKAAGF